MAKRKPPERPTAQDKRRMLSEAQGSWTDFMFSFRTLFTVVCLSIALWFSYQGYLETRVNTPFDSKKVLQKYGLDVPEKYWGTYRPGVYFGMKTREPYSPVMGLMWYSPNHMRSPNDIRHWCEQGDDLLSYAWYKHDGKRFGIQHILDGPFKLTTSFVKRPGGKNGGDWTARIEVKPKDEKAIGEKVYFIFYTAFENQTEGAFLYLYDTSPPTTIGETKDLGMFSLKLHIPYGSSCRYSHLSAFIPGGLHHITDTVKSSLKRMRSTNSSEVIYTLPGTLTNQANFVAVQLEATVPFMFEALYQSSTFSNRPNILTEGVYDQELRAAEQDFNDRFESTFHLNEEKEPPDNTTVSDPLGKFSSEYIQFAQMAFSNLLGGIGYFYGSSRVKSDNTPAPVPYWKAPLYTAVPSRSFFPRGFLWDEGFHGLLLAAWDLDLELDIMSYWMDLMNVEGWIPREQILGSESLAKVPPEFVTQVNTNANPPTFFLTLEAIIRRYPDQLLEGERLATLERMYPRLSAWFHWFNTKQSGPLPASYRWRGRVEDSAIELNPKTLTSGLDDYPRASHPTPQERHLDLRCWIHVAAGTMARISALLNKNPSKFLETWMLLGDIGILDSLHWSELAGRYADYGLHTDNVKLERYGHFRHGEPLPPFRRVVLTPPRLRLVDSNFGYISLAPLLLRILPPSSPRLGSLLMDLANPKLLWTPFGLRSLSPDSPLYMKRNTEHDPPYWRGAIWINMNYLALAALHHYGTTAGPHKAKAYKLYRSLRANVVTNIFNQFNTTGYIWENYNDVTGKGQGSHPFTGWSSLVVLIMAEIY